jgi:hypothetical protein
VLLFFLVLVFDVASLGAQAWRAAASHAVGFSLEAGPFWRIRSERRGGVWSVVDN